MDHPSMILLQLKMQLCGHLDMVNVFELMAQAAQQLLENLIVDLPLPADAKNALPLPKNSAIALVQALDKLQAWSPECVAHVRKRRRIFGTTSHQ
jgi:hypothetical protein